MSPNANYVAGRSFEYARKAAWEAEGYEVVRTAGSHGAYDLIAFRKDNVVFIQCKLTQDAATMERLAFNFLETPPIALKGVGQVLEVRIKGAKEVRRFWLP